MSNPETITGARPSESPRWLVALNAVLAACSALAAAISLWSAEQPSIAIVVTFLVVLCAVAFLLGMHAHRRNWQSKWYVQIAGPALSVFVLFGTHFAMLAVGLGVVAALLLSRIYRARENAA